jgi:hypothetical protein
MATRFVKVFVVDDDGRGAVGQRVKTYGGNEQRTDRSGAVLISLEGSQVSIYVNGHTAFNGPVSRLGREVVFTRAGRMA